MKELNDAHDDLTNQTQTHQITPIIGGLLFLMASALLGIWIMQHSINSYFLQTYHKPSPLTKLSSPLWEYGGNIGNELYANYHNMASSIEHINQHIVNSFNEHYAYTPHYKALLIEKQKQEAIKLAAQDALRQQQLAADKKRSAIEASLTINKSHKVFFAGDSMMQGIAPHIQKYLQEMGIDSINLSKQSTGLAYPKFFDWPNTIKQTIAKDKSIKVLMVMLGPNDPWDMPDSQGKYLTFNTPEWTVNYQARIADIINFAKEHHVGVIWITPPNMKKDKLNEQMILLNDIIGEELARHSVKVIDSRPIMGSVNNRYNDYLTKDGKQIKMRSSDGIHFSADGQKILAKAVQSQLIIE